jgi:hypothetical protein
VRETFLATILEGAISYIGPTEAILPPTPGIRTLIDYLLVNGNRCQRSWIDILDRPNLYNPLYLIINPLGSLFKRLCENEFFRGIDDLRFQITSARDLPEVAILAQLLEEPHLHLACLFLRGKDVACLLGARISAKLHDFEDELLEPRQYFEFEGSLVELFEWITQLPIAEGRKKLENPLKTLKKLLQDSGREVSGINFGKDIDGIAI